MNNQTKKEVISECLKKLAEAGVGCLNSLQSEFEELTFADSPEGKKYYSNIEKMKNVIHNIDNSEPIKLVIECELKAKTNITKYNLQYEQNELTGYKTQNVKITSLNNVKINRVAKQYIENAIQRIVPCEQAICMFDAEFRKNTKQLYDLSLFFIDFEAIEVLKDIKNEQTKNSD